MEVLVFTNKKKEMKNLTLMDHIDSFQELHKSLLSACPLFSVFCNFLFKEEKMQLLNVIFQYRVRL